MSSEGAVVLHRRAAFPPRIPTLCVVTVFVEEESGIAKVKIKDVTCSIEVFDTEVSQLLVE